MLRVYGASAVRHLPPRRAKLNNRADRIEIQRVKGREEQEAD